MMQLPRRAHVSGTPIYRESSGGKLGFLLDRQKLHCIEKAMHNTAAAMGQRDGHVKDVRCSGFNVSQTFETRTKITIYRPHHKTTTP